MSKTKNLIVTLFFMFIFLINLTFGQNNTGTIEYLASIVGRIANALIMAFWALVVIFGIYTAYLYLTAGGDEKKVDKAKKAFIYLIIAIAVVAVLTFLKNAIPNLFGVEFPEEFGDLK